MNQNILALTIDRRDGKSDITFALRRLIIAGWVGRDKKAVQEHIDELGKLGVPAPTRTPTYMNLTAGIASTTDNMDVVGADSSGEVECVVFKDNDQLFIGVGSDHTDREFEKYGIPASKQMCPKIMAPVIWDYKEVKDHIDQIFLRSWMTRDGERMHYQEGTLGTNVSIEDLMSGIPINDGLPLDNYCMFCGTFPAISGLVYGERFDFEMEDPVLNRKISHGYSVRVLPQYL